MSTKTAQKLDRNVTVSSMVGTAIEWYDFYVYGTASALVFGALFFTGSSHGPSEPPYSAISVIGLAERGCSCSAFSV